MAVEDKYAANIEDGDTAYVHAAQSQGAPLVHLVQDIEVAAADDDGSVYRIFRNIPSSFVPTKMDFETDAITGGTDYDIGLYDVDLGAVVDADCFADGLDPSSGYKGYSALNGLDAMAIENIGQQSLWEIAGETLGSQQSAYDIAVTANTVGSAAGTLVLHIWGHMA